MRVLLAVYGSYGHVALYIRLAQELTSLGHEVLFITESVFLREITKYGFKAVSTHHTKTYDDYDVGKILCDYHLFNLTAYHQFFDFADSFAPDLIIRDPITMPLAALYSDFTKIPRVEFGGSLAYFISDECKKRFQEVTIGPWNRIREEIGLPPEETTSIDVFSRSNPIFLDIPRFYVDKIENSDIIDKINFTSFFFLLQKDKLQESVESFLRKRPVVFSMGTGAKNTLFPNNLYEIAKQISETYPVLVLGRCSIKETENFKVISEVVPHHKIFNKAKVVVHHGGVGTVGKCFWTNVAQIAIPQTGENAISSQLVSDYIEIVPPDQVSHETLIDAINSANKFDEYSHYKFLHRNSGPKMMLDKLLADKYLHE